MYTLVLLRHGQSIHNLEKKFSGWSDVPLTDQGRQEAIQAGNLLKKQGFSFDKVHTNMLTRAITTTWLVLEQMDLVWIPIAKSWRLNERSYGALQTFSHAEWEEKTSKEQVYEWRRTFDAVPPQLELNDSRFPGNDPRYADVPRDLLPRGESLKMTLDRVLPYWQETLIPEVKTGKRLLVSASHNSLRALYKYLNQVSDEEIPHVEIPTGKPFVHILNEDISVADKYYIE